ncbi:MAG: hypothetical protein ABI400_08285 [Lacisediminihabitans sp.]
MAFQKVHGTALGASWRRMVTVGGVLIAIMVALVIAFALPGIHSAPRDVPITIVGSPSQRTQIEAALDKAGEGVWHYQSAPTATIAQDEILGRAVYGAFVATDTGAKLYYASAASEAVATLLTQTEAHLAAATGGPVATKDVSSFTSGDPRGIGLAAGALPIALGGWVAAVGIIMLIAGTWQRLATAGGFAIVGGFALIGVLYGIGTLQGNYLGNSLAAMLAIGATSFLVLGLQRFLKAIGIGIAALVLIVLGNPLSGLSSAPELLPQPWGALGQLLPPGATGTLLRNVSFFDGHAIGLPVTVLFAWLVLGLVMYGFGTLREGRNFETLTIAID